MSSDSPNKGDFTRRVLIVAGISFVGVIVLYLLRHVANVLLVAFAGILLAVFLDGLASILQRRLHVPRGVGLALVIIVLTGFAVGVSWFAGPRIADQFSKLAQKIPEALSGIRAFILGLPFGKEMLKGSSESTTAISLSSQLVGRLSGIFTTTVGTMVDLFMIAFIGLYAAATPRLYIDNAILLLPKEKRARAHQVVASVRLAMRWWLVGRFSTMAVVGILTAFGLWIIGVPLALTLGLIAAVLSFVPFMGAVVSAIPAMLVALVESPAKMLLVVVVFTIVHQLESDVFTPLIQRRAVFIPPVLLITAQILLGVLFGLLGVLLATPLTVIVIVLVQCLYVEDVLHERVRKMGEHHYKP